MRLRARDSSVRLVRLPTPGRYRAPDADPQVPTWECSAPCDMLIARADETFVVRGPGISDSETFTLYTSGGAPATIDVRAGSTALRPWGLVSTGVGIGSFVLGGLVALFAGLIYAPANDPWIAGGFVGMGVGAILFVGGLVSVRFGTTRVEVKFGAAPQVSGARMTTE